MYHHIKLNDKGVSLVEAMIASVIFITIVFTSMGLISQSSKNIIKQEKSENQSSIKESVQKKLENLVLNTKGVGDESLLCDLLEAEEVDYGATEIDFVYKKDIIKSLFSPKNMKYMNGLIGKIKDLEFCGVKKQAYRFGICGKINSKHPAAKGLEDLYIASYLDIKQIVSRRKAAFKSKGTISKAKLSAKENKIGLRADAKEIIFEVNTELLDKDKKIIAKDTKLQWLANLKNCKQGDKRVEVSATGLGDKEGKVIYNRTVYGEVPSNPLEAHFHKKVSQEGTIGSGGTLLTDVSKNIVASCIETKFRCKNSNATREFSPNLDYDMRLKFNRYNKTLNTEELIPNFKVGFSTEKSNFGNIDPKKVSIESDSQPYASDGSGNYYARISDRPQDGFDRNRPLSLIKGTATFNLRMGTPKSTCNRVCDRQDLKVFPRVEITDNRFPDFKQIFKPSEKLGCTVCLMKNCKRLGFGTFGPVAHLGNEPKDGLLPECALKNSGDVASSDPVKNLVVSDMNNGNKCFAAKVDRNQNAVVIAPKACNTKLPVLCYNYGTYSLAKRVNLKEDVYERSSFKKAPRVCYLMGAEGIKAGNLTKLFDQYSTGSAPSRPLARLLSLKNTVSSDEKLKKLKNYSLSRVNIAYVNNVAQGSFLAPQTQSQVTDMITSLDSNQADMKNKWFWIALSKSEVGEIYPAPPVASSLNRAEEKFAFYFDNGIPRVDVDTSNPSAVLARTTGQKRGFVLLNDIRFKGVLPADQVQTNPPRHLAQSAEMPFMCQKNGRFFVSNSKSRKQVDGHSKCRSSGGVFVPPSTSLQWAQAMSALNSNSGELPFPNSAARPKAWVALAQNAGDSSYRWVFPQVWEDRAESVVKGSGVQFDKDLDFSGLSKYNQKAKDRLAEIAAWDANKAAGIAAWEAEKAAQIAAWEAAVAVAEAATPPKPKPARPKAPKKPTFGSRPRELRDPVIKVACVMGKLRDIRMVSNVDQCDRLKGKHASKNVLNSPKLGKILHDRAQRLRGHEFFSMR